MQVPATKTELMIIGLREITTKKTDLKEAEKKQIITIIEPLRFKNSTGWKCEDIWISPLFDLSTFKLGTYEATVQVTTYNGKPRVYIDSIGQRIADLPL